MRIAITLSLCLLFCSADALVAQEKQSWAIGLHGGAGSDPGKLSAGARMRREESLAKALRIGKQALSRGESGLVAVERVIRYLEDDPKFNAGKGAVFNAAGGHELDASIMDGKTKACGAVAGVTTVKNPITLAKLVMTKTRHVLLSGDGADQFAREMRVERVDKEYFWTPPMKARFLESKGETGGAKANAGGDDHKGTVGCVVLDRYGNLAAGTSTGGLAMKRFGRVGDSPIIGAGTYADNGSCAVSCTGIGEEFIRHAIAFSISARMKLVDESVSQSVQHAMRKTLKPGDGGIIAVSKTGEIAIDYNTPGMSYGFADSSGKFEVGLKKTNR